jgi:hypothetical protein
MEPGSVHVRLLDTETGERVWSNDEFKNGFIAFWWAEGNGSCDCNRRYVFDIECAPDERYCIGAKRFLICNVVGDTGGYTLRDFNADYPVELRKKWDLP